MFYQYSTFKKRAKSKEENPHRPDRLTQPTDSQTDRQTAICAEIA